MLHAIEFLLGKLRAEQLMSLRDTIVGKAVDLLDGRA
jgi:hypothetical protein